MKSLMAGPLRRLELYKATRVSRAWYSRGAHALSRAIHRRKMRKFYSQFLAEGDLCFDVGANVGNRTRIFVQLGASVVCIEPHHSCAEHLRSHYGRRPDVVVLEKAVGDHEGHAELAVCDRDPALSSLFDEWRTKSRFAKDHRWTRAQRVPLTTLDALIAEYGIPRFCKIDVEGFEEKVLRGLTRPIPFLSFEFTREFLQNAWDCVDHILSTGPHKFQFSIGETMEFLFQEWVPEGDLHKELLCADDELLWGDIYAKHV